MQQTVRWLVAASVVLGTFAASAWVAGALVLPVWMRSETDRWAIGSGLGVALAALAALWGKGFAQRRLDDSHRDAERPADIQMTAEASGKARVYQAGHDQTVNER